MADNSLIIINLPKKMDGFGWLQKSQGKSPVAHRAKCRPTRGPATCHTSGTAAPMFGP